jgi:hypothetical protein
MVPYLYRHIFDDDSTGSTHIRSRLSQRRAFLLHPILISFLSSSTRICWIVHRHSGGFHIFHYTQTGSRHKPYGME